MDHIDLSGMRVGFRRRGDGPGLVLLHGGLCDSRVWRVELESFADVFTVVAWDTPGCGGSSDAPENFRMPEYAGCLAGLVDALGFDHFQVLGHSWGSTLALELCRQRPDLVRSLVLVGGYAGWAGSLPATEVRERLTASLELAKGDAPPFDPRSVRGLFSDVMPADRAEELARIMSEVRPAATRTMAQAMAEADLCAVLPSVRVPTLIVQGDADVRSSPEVGRALRDAIPGSTLTVLPGLGHECFLESADAFEAAVRPFLLAHR